MYKNNTQKFYYGKAWYHVSVKQWLNEKLFYCIFNNFSVILWWSGKIVDVTRDPTENNLKSQSTLSKLSCKQGFQYSLWDRPFNLKGGLWFIVSFRKKISDNTRVRILIFFVTQNANFFFQNLTLGYITKTLNQIIFFSSTKIRIFFSATLGIRIFF